MNESNNNNSTAMLGGFLLGAAVGAGLAILFAPAPGSETRRQIAGKARELGSDAQGKLDHLRHAVTDAARGVKSAVNEGRETFRRETSTSYATSDAP